PLNNLLILSDQLSRNTERNLTVKQVEFAKTIHASGNDLLALIADILDLSKIESGTVAVDVSELRLAELGRYVERSFRHIADSKGVEFQINLDPSLPKTVHTDAKRLQQIIKNLLSNAFKFTHAGKVALSVAPATSGWSPECEELDQAERVVAYTVTDTGIGISTDKQHIIFEAFQQADGSTSRKYGGTGLGLAISRELSKLLGGEIRLFSAPGAGSTFTLYLPQSYAAPRARPRVATPQPDTAREPAAPTSVEAVSLELETSLPFVNEAGDDRDEIKPGDDVLLIVENDLGFAKVLLDAARQQGFKGIVASSGAAALAMSREYEPAVMTLDIFLPDMQGWRVLDRIKADLATRHIPVCVVSTDDARERALNSGAIGFIGKPLTSRDSVDHAIENLRAYLSRPLRQVALLMPGGAERDEIVARLGAADVVVLLAEGGEHACRMLETESIDCLVVQDARELRPEAVIAALEERAVTQQLPVVLYGTVDPDRTAQWQRGKGVLALREARSTARLLDYVYFFLHRNAASMSQDERQALEDLHSSSCILEGRKALIVDDDMRNIFALATVLDEQGMEIVSANNGREAISMVENDPSIDIVLMDIMMPEMDGIATTQEIRKLQRGKDLPIIAVTAKAMKGDRVRCIEAGAWDYLSKPVDRVHLLAVLSGWLYR
ncbi:MAG TPA: response regulator, partial [Burkholderiales bacterium]|nr:response regulator [Burkholderiales bacterium]